MCLARRFRAVEYETRRICVERFRVALGSGHETTATTGRLPRLRLPLRHLVASLLSSQHRQRSTPGSV